MREFIIKPVRSRENVMASLRGNWNYPTAVRFGPGRIADDAPQPQPVVAANAASAAAAHCRKGGPIRSHWPIKRSTKAC